MATIALELIPTSVEGGQPLALEEAQKTRAQLEKSGLLQHVNTLVVPQMIPEEGDRPVALDAKLDALDSSLALRQEIPASFILTQVTVFTPRQQLDARVSSLKQAGVERVVFVGVPRVFDDADIVGPSPNEALGIYSDMMPSRGAILIPTRPDEEGRFRYKLECGANFAMTQLLYSDHIAGFLEEMSQYPYRPEILLSFGFVPQAELRVGLVRWLIKDETSPFVAREIERVTELAGMPFQQKKAAMVEDYQRVVERVSAAGFPVGIHFECPYGLSDPAMETFNAMLDAWRPDTQATG